MRIQANSLTVADDVSQKDRQDIESRTKNDVLESSRFPEIVFDSTKIAGGTTGDGRFNAAITGDLTLHGVTPESYVQRASGRERGDSSRLRGIYSPSDRLRHRHWYRWPAAR